MGSSRGRAEGMWRASPSGRAAGPHAPDARAAPLGIHCTRGVRNGRRMESRTPVAPFAPPSQEMRMGERLLRASHGRTAAAGGDTATAAARWPHGLCLHGARRIALPMRTVGCVCRSRTDAAAIQVRTPHDAAPTSVPDISYHVAGNWVAWLSWYVAALPVARSVKSRVRVKRGTRP